MKDELYILGDLNCGLLKPGFHIILWVVPVAPVFSDIFEMIGATGTTLTRLWFPYSRPSRPRHVRLVEVI